MMFDPVSLWMQSSVFWFKIFKQQQEAYFRALGTFAVSIPHEDSADLAREAEAMKDMLKPAPKPAQSTARKPAHRKRRKASADLVGA